MLKQIGSFLATRIRARHRDGYGAEEEQPTANTVPEQELARVRAALERLEPDCYCEWCSAEEDDGKLVHASDCPFAALVEEG